MLPRLGDVMPHWARRQSRQRERTPSPVPCATCLDTGFVLPAKLTPEYCSCERGKAAWQEELQQYQEMQTVLAENRRQALERKLKLPERCQAFILESSPLVGTAVHQAVLDFLATWDEHRGLLLVGDIGTGKTGLLVGLLKRLVPLAVERQWQARFVTAPTLFVELQQGFTDGSYAQTLRDFSTAYLLGLDDIGAERESAWITTQFFQILNERYDARLPLLATTNCEAEELEERLGKRGLDRLKETCTVVEVRGKSLRSR